MRVLLDTHVWIWSQESPEQLGSDARSSVADFEQRTGVTLPKDIAAMLTESENQPPKF